MGVTQSGALSLKWINSILNLGYKESEKLAMSSDPGSNGILFFHTLTVRDHHLIQAPFVHHSPALVQAAAEMT